MRRLRVPRFSLGFPPSRLARFSLAFRRLRLPRFSLGFRRLRLPRFSSRLRRFRFPRFSPPWTMPGGATPTAEMSTAEIVSEAQGEPPFYRIYGLRDAAWVRPARMNRQYLRTRDFLGRLGLGPYLWQWALTLCVGMGFAILARPSPHTSSPPTVAPKGWSTP